MKKKCKFVIMIIVVINMQVSSKELEQMKKELKSLTDDFFALSKEDETAKKELLEKMVDLENNIQKKYNELKGI